MSYHDKYHTMLYHIISCYSLYVQSSRLRLLVILGMSCLNESRFLHKAGASARLMPASASMQPIQSFLWRPLLLELLVMHTIKSFSKLLSFRMQCPKKRNLNRHILASGGSGLRTLSRVSIFLVFAIHGILRRLL